MGFLSSPNYCSAFTTYYSFAYTFLSRYAEINFLSPYFRPCNPFSGLASSRSLPSNDWNSTWTLTIFLLSLSFKENLFSSPSFQLIPSHTGPCVICIRIFHLVTNTANCLWVVPMHWTSVYVPRS